MIRGTSERWGELTRNDLPLQALAFRIVSSFIHASWHLIARHLLNPRTPPRFGFYKNRRNFRLFRVVCPRGLSPTYVTIATLPNIEPKPYDAARGCAPLVVDDDRHPCRPDLARPATPHHYTCPQWMVIVTCACGSNETGIRFMNPKGDCLATLDTNQVTDVLLFFCFFSAPICVLFFFWVHKPTNVVPTRVDSEERS